jgi:SAM-dependent methyltransferase
VGSATPPLQNVYDYYTTQILERLGITNVVFRSYLERKLATLDRPIRILSLASGAARIEEGLIDGIDAERIELVLTDLNPSLLSTARARLAHRARLETLELNLNQLTLPSRRFDVVVCVSALHHVVELEQLFAQVAASLLEDGEFWSIGEYIGRNGTRLYPEAYSIANDFFQALPEHYRVNRNPGGRGGVDDRLPNLDCSATCFEGIRSEEIVPLMDRYFAPVEVMKFDCFLWRLFNLAYFDNYDLGREEDLALVHSAIDLEEEFARAGGQPTAMHGVFRLQDERSAGS